MTRKSVIQENLSKEILYLFNTGKLYHAYRNFGAQLTDGGVQFTVWVPDAQRVRVVGDFNQWGKGEIFGLEPIGSTGVFTGFVPGISDGNRYKYEIITDKGDRLLKADPFAFGSELRPDTASIVTDLSYQWQDEDWMAKRPSKDVFSEPMNIYEIHLGSWMRHPVEDGFYSYDEITEKLIPYIKEMGYTHLEFLPVMEHPLDASWGYQVTGYFSATSRFGRPTGLKKLIDACHQNGIGVILDWVPGHFCPDAHGLANFNGHMLYEKEIHPDWGTYKFDFGRNQVRSFLLSNAMFWMEEYHVDGLRVDGVSSMLYLNFGKTDESTKIYNSDGGDTDTDAIEFIKEFNTMIGNNFPGTFTAAEESSAFPMVTKPPFLGGLGFHLKWNMGWMNDTLKYMETDFPFREYDHNKLTFSMAYADSENFILPLSHDEVVHGKKSLIGRMPGDLWRKFAGLRALTMYQMTHPGKKLNFMGHENAPFIEWREYEELEWFMLQYDNHRMYRDFVKALNKVYVDNPPLWQRDTKTWEGFKWIDADNKGQCILSYLRMADGKEEKPKTKAKAKGKAKATEEVKDDFLAVVINMNLLSIDDFRIGVPAPGKYQEIFNSDRTEFGGNNRLNETVIKADDIPMHGYPYSIELKVPVLGGTILRRIGK